LGKEGRFSTKETEKAKEKKGTSIPRGDTT